MSQDLLFFGQRILFVGAHPDDIEIGCGALIAHIGKRAEIRCITLSDNQKNPDLKYLVEEHYRSMAVLGIAEDKIFVGKFITRHFPTERQEILEYLIQIKSSFQPNIVFTHTRADIHQDHQTAMEETLRAFRGITVLGYDVLRSSYGFFPNFLVGVTESDVQQKLDALLEYNTYQTKYYFDPDITKATLIRNGALAERPYAEGFDILRIVSSFGSMPLENNNLD